MAIRSSLVLLLPLLVCMLALLSEPTIAGFNPSEFPNGFYYGSSTSAYQTEGMANKSGRGPSLWDTYTHDHPERIEDGTNGDEGVDMYHRYAEDIQKMKDAGLNAFRFSISWSRIIPHGQIRSGVNEEGISFYNRLINEALAKELEPFVTIFHWDTPQALEDKYGGFLSPDIVADFRDYAKLCFEKFGDRVRYWITLNEPSAYASWGYDTGEFAPGRCSPWVNRLCQGGDSATEAYIVTHHLLLSHAAAVKLYREKYKPTQKGKIGFTLVSAWYEPYNSNSSRDIDSAKRSLDFHFGWYMDPVTYGDYPRSMRDYVKDRLPKFTYEQSMLVKGSIDFLGLNYYTAKFSKHVDHVDPDRISYANDPHRILGVKNSEGNYIGPLAGLSWFRVVPYGIRYLLNYTKDNYRNPEIYITENGIPQDNSSAYNDLVHDQVRVNYYNDHLGNVSEAIRNHNVTVKGYFAWSFMDNFEWSSGYSKRFGLMYIDYNKNLTRIPKDSIEWFTNHLLDQPKIKMNKWSRPLGFKGYSM